MLTIGRSLSPTEKNSFIGPIFIGPYTLIQGWLGIFFANFLKIVPGTHGSTIKIALCPQPMHLLRNDNVLIFNTFCISVYMVWHFVWSIKDRSCILVEFLLFTGFHLYCLPIVYQLKSVGALEMKCEKKLPPLQCIFLRSQESCVKSFRLKSWALIFPYS